MIIPSEFWIQRDSGRKVVINGRGPAPSIRTFNLQRNENYGISEIRIVRQRGELYDSQPLRRCRQYDDVANIIQAQLLFLESQDPAADIHMLITPQPVRVWQPAWQVSFSVPGMNDNVLSHRNETALKK